MTLPDSFHFTQSSLQDYLDCSRRFQLRCVLDQPWPAVESELRFYQTGTIGMVNRQAE